MAGRMQAPSDKFRTPTVFSTVSDYKSAEPLPFELLHNPYNGNYVINGCPIHSRHFRWVSQETFYQLPNSQWVCEDCGDIYTQEQVDETLSRDQLKQDMDILEWPVKYSWAGAMPHNGGSSLECPHCHSVKTSYGTVSGPTGPLDLMRWKCHKCAWLFDLLDIPAYWGLKSVGTRPTRTPEQMEADAIWKEDARLEALYGTEPAIEFED